MSMNRSQSVQLHCWGPRSGESPFLPHKTRGCSLQGHRNGLKLKLPTTSTLLFLPISVSLCNTSSRCNLAEAQLFSESCVYPVRQPLATHNCCVSSALHEAHLACTSPLSSHLAILVMNFSVHVCGFTTCMATIEGERLTLSHCM